MILAMPLEEAQKNVCVSFGRAPFFLFYNTDSLKKEILENPAAEAEGGAGVTAAQFLVDHQADVLLTVRCGENAKKVFDAANVKICKTKVDSAEENMQLFLKNELAPLSKFHAGFHGLR